MEDNPTLIFALAAFVLAAVLIWQRDNIPQKLKRGMAIISLVLVAFAFFLIVYTVFTAGS
ncbi:hypothetical protein [Cohnella fermenti]|uniref:Signal transduction histidine kinase n=1 Tax=Cohnella fermenti TaxID=2565925 RepID=A0A4S4BXL0_9BACL|nr:hypothetical protein [Cohnella fermenti]THF79941.1 hypothetical protein E6C55_11490 [Cohnella fermenti]